MRSDGLGGARLDAALRSTLVVDPPLELQLRLAALVQAEPLAEPASSRFAVGWSLPLAVAMSALAVWQLYQWLSGWVGDAWFALQVLLTSPLVVWLGELPEGLDLTGLAFWSALGAAGWLVSPSGPLRDLPARLGVQV